eukprot:TRINITY_DN3778_c0_g1_i6.p1 TRINITY_DN3778_c0_g1~~TRINITY_DN3778_c0_g1_i6.p1  ORF type:complete len:241 (-),score=17.20 TRINITY_DN3778_c0_g1_i6:49-771(-)
MPLLPLWSGIILRTVNSDGNVTDSNAIVENWFRIVKHSIFNSETGIQAADFIRTIYTNIDDRIAAFKFAFTPLAHKVFKPKKRTRIENGDECKEEWSRCKKSKFSYTKPNIEKVSEVFTSFKTSECLMNTESIMSVERQVEVDKVGDNIVEVGDVGVISDLDLIEVATLDYKLSGYRRLTYSGQMKLCEEFDLKLLDSTNCIRGDIPVSSNLRDPSKVDEDNCRRELFIYFIIILVDRQY